MSRSDDQQTPSAVPELPAELARALDRGSAPVDLDGLYASLRADIARDRGLRAWLRARSTAVRVLAAATLIAGLGAAAALAFVRSDLPSYPAGRWTLTLTALGALAVVSLVIALRPLQQPGLPRWAAPVAVTASLLALATLYLISPLEAGVALDAASMRPALTCLAIGLALGAPVYALIALLDRGGVRRALPMAAAAGLAANLVLHIHCPWREPWHLMLGHFGAAALLLVAVALWVRARD